MLGGVLLASYGLSTGGAAGNILYQLEQQGVFSYILPFLMIFAVLYGILSKIKIFENNGINIVLSIAVGLMSLQLNFVSYFFREIFPRMGVMLSLILVGIILFGAFWKPGEGTGHKWIKYVIGGLIAVGFIVIVVQSLGSAFIGSWGLGGGGSWGFSFWLQRNLDIIVIVAMIVIGFVLVIKGNKGGSNPNPPAQNNP